jgi:hypothetical protein
MGIRSLIVAAACAVLVVSCSGGDDTPRLAAGATPAVRAPSSTVTTAATTSLSGPSTAVSPTTSRANVAPTTTASTSAAPGAAVEPQLASRVRGLFVAREAANAAPAPKPDSAQLAEFASGEALLSIRDETTRRRDLGQAIRASAANLAQLRVGFVTMTGTTATVAACSVDDGVIFEVATGRVVNDSVITHNYRIDLEQVGGVWRVSRIVRIQQWEGVAGCARSPGDFPY